MIVKPNTRVPVISYGRYNSSLSPSIELVDKNNQSQVINTGRVADTFAEFVLPPEYVTSSNLPATMNCKVGNNVVKTAYLELPPNPPSAGGIDGPPAWFKTSPGDKGTFNSTLYTSFEVLEDLPRCPARPDLLEVNPEDNKKLIVRKAGIYEVNIYCDFAIAAVDSGQPIAEGAAFSAGSSIALGVNGENEPPAWNLYPNVRTQFPDYAAMGASALNQKITSVHFSIVQPLEVGDYIEMPAAVYVSTHTLTNNDFTNWAWSPSKHVSFVRLGDW